MHIFTKILNMHGSEIAIHKTSSLKFSVDFKKAKKYLRQSPKTPDPLCNPVSRFQSFIFVFMLLNVYLRVFPILSLILTENLNCSKLWLLTLQNDVLRLSLIANAETVVNLFLNAEKF